MCTINIQPLGCAQGARPGDEVIIVSVIGDKTRSAST